MTEIEYLKQLLAFPSISENKNETKKCAQYCSNFFENAGMHSKVIEYNGYPNVFATTQKTNKPKVLLQAHMDVVPAKDELFVLKIAPDKLMGRGVFDMKFACACYMKILDELKGSLDKYDFGIMLSFDEEVGGHNGVEAFLNDGYACDVCVLPDSGQNWHIECNAKGAWWAKLTKTGKNAHASVAHEGENALELILPALSELLQYESNYQHKDASINLTQISSGKATNQIPDKAEAIYDIRFRNMEIYESIRSEFERVCAKYKVDLSTKEFSGCTNVDRNNKYVKSFEKIAEDVLGRKIIHSSSDGATDARYFCPKNIPVIIFQPNGGGRHGDDEWIEVGGMEKLSTMILRFIKENA